MRAMLILPGEEVAAAPTNGIRRGGIYALLAPAALVAAVHLLGGCASEPKGGGAGGAPADAQLAKFGREHPRCQLWTNWQKMCSRTGRGGEPHCVTDPDMPVTPSEPFCVYEGLGAHVSDLDTPDAGSRERFCIRTTTYGVSDGKTLVKGIRACAEFTPHRPFNGRNLAARRHPWCGEWSDAWTERPVCREVMRRGDSLPSCKVLAASGYVHDRPLQCSRFTAPNWCAAPRDMLDRHRPRPDEITFGEPGYRSSNILPVHGVVCERRTVQ